MGATCTIARLAPHTFARFVSLSARVDALVTRNCAGLAAGVCRDEEAWRVPFVEHNGQRNGRAGGVRAGVIERAPVFSASLGRSKPRSAGGLRGMRDPSIGAHSGPSANAQMSRYNARTDALTQCSRDHAGRAKPRSVSMRPLGPQGVAFRDPRRCQQLALLQSRDR